MSQVNTEIWALGAQLYSFIGNSLLKPMTQTSDVGITTDFWKSTPEIPTDNYEIGHQKLLKYARMADTVERKKAVEQCAVEYTKLFVGPAAPAAPPWETMNKGEKTTVGFGQATFEMKRLLRESGLKLDNENNQYEDHMGIELLYLSVLCDRIVDQEQSSQIHYFITQHPLSWIDDFRFRIDEVSPDGYFSGLMQLCQGLLEWHAAAIGAIGDSPGNES